MSEKLKAKHAEMNRNPRIEYGKVELAADEFAPENTKVRLSMWIDGDILQAVKASAKTDVAESLPPSACTREFNSRGELSGSFGRRLSS
jgi:hypothetical protein